MRRYLVTPHNKFDSYKKDWVEAKTPMEALKIYLKKNNISYKSIIRITHKVNKDL